MHVFDVAAPHQMLRLVKKMVEVGEVIVREAAGGEEADAEEKEIVERLRSGIEQVKRMVQESGMGGEKQPQRMKLGEEEVWVLRGYRALCGIHWQVREVRESLGEEVGDEDVDESLEWLQKHCVNPTKIKLVGVGKPQKIKAAQDKAMRGLVEVVTRSRNCLCHFGTLGVDGWRELGRVAEAVWKMVGGPGGDARLDVGCDVDVDSIEPGYEQEKTASEKDVVVERNTILEDVWRGLVGGGRGGPGKVVVVHGISGAGKTLIAEQIVSKWRKEEDGQGAAAAAGAGSASHRTHWVHGGSMMRDLAGLGEKLGLCGKDDQDVVAQLGTRLRDSFDHEGAQWLIVFDDISRERADEMQEFQLPWERMWTLVTSQMDDVAESVWQGGGAVKTLSVAVDALLDHEMVELVQRLVLQAAAARRPLEREEGEANRSEVCEKSQRTRRPRPILSTTR
jgi:hypothetical protein